MDEPSFVVRTIKKIRSEEKVYDITVSDNHNLFVVDSSSSNKEIGVLVHNCLDENLKFIGTKQYKPYSLEMIELRYGLNRPSSLAISKEERKNMASFPMKDIAIYGSYDVTTLFDIRDRQRQQAINPLIGYKKLIHFDKVVVNQIGIMTKVFAIVQNNGIQIDVDHLLKLSSKDGPFDKELKTTLDKLYSLPSVKKLNKRLLKRKGLASSNLFQEETQLFNLGKPAHKQELYFDILKLEPVSFGKAKDENGNPKPSTDKAFQAAYKDVEEVAALTTYNKITKLKSSFVDAILNRIIEDTDFIKDGRLRSSYAFFLVVSGRLSSFDINSQQIPSRGPLAKPIKEAFIVKPGNIFISSDFSAHEVRMGGNISHDKIMREVFLAANAAILEFRLKKISPEELDDAKKLLERKGDIHILNIKFFYGLDVDKKHVLRDQIKAVVFGVLYGKMAKNLAKALGISEEEAQALIDKLFEKWYGLKEWIDTTHEVAENTFLVHYPNFRIRHLWGYISADEWVHFAMNRRAINSPVQGFSSDIGVTGIHELNRWIDHFITKKGFDFDCKSINLVHDAQYLETLFKNIALAIYLTEHSMSTLPMNYYSKHFGYNFSIPLSYDIDIGTNWGKTSEWDKRPESLFNTIKDLGEKLNLDSDPVIEDAKKIMSIRIKELKTDPYKMLITSNNCVDLWNELNMFKEQQ